MKYKILHLPSGTFLYAEDYLEVPDHDTSIYTEFELQDEYSYKVHEDYIVCVFNYVGIMDRVKDKLSTSDYFNFSETRTASVIEEFQLIEVP